MNEGTDGRGKSFKQKLHYSWIKMHLQLIPHSIQLSVMLMSFSNRTDLLLYWITQAENQSIWTVKAHLMSECNKISKKVFKSDSGGHCFFWIIVISDFSPSEFWAYFLKFSFFFVSSTKKKNSKVDCNFLCHNYDFLSQYLAILTYNWQFWEKKSEVRYFLDH